jgi:heme-degrading monooxygenase HmoA
VKSAARAVSLYLIVWSFEVKPESVEEFERAYGPAGEWARLFRKAPGYQGTELLRDVDATERYLTIDRWRSREDFWSLREAFRAEYLALDARCEALTTRELLVGDFETRES